MLKRLTQAIWSGEKVGLRTKHEVQDLMMDERYRNYVLVKLLAESHEFHYDPDLIVPNVVSTDRRLCYLFNINFFSFSLLTILRPAHSHRTVHYFTHAFQDVITIFFRFCSLSAEKNNDITIARIYHGIGLNSHNSVPFVYLLVYLFYLFIFF